MNIIGIMLLCVMPINAQAASAKGVGSVNSVKSVTESKTEGRVVTRGPWKVNHTCWTYPVLHWLKERPRVFRRCW